MGTPLITRTAEDGTNGVDRIDCPVCGTSGGEVAIEEDGHTGVRCPDCGTIYVSPRPTASELAALYDGAHGAFGVNSWKRRLFGRHALEILGDHQPSGSLLEIGPGDGHVLAVARERYEVHALEVDPVAARTLETELGVPCETEPLDETNPFDREFDVIYHRNVASHFRDPTAVFRRSAELLADDGVLVFETGNLADVDPAYYELFSTFHYPEHLCFFGDEGVDRLLADAGLERIETRRFGKTAYLQFLRLFAPLRSRLRDWLTDSTETTHDGSTEPTPDAADPVQADSADTRQADAADERGVERDDRTDGEASENSQSRRADGGTAGATLSDALYRVLESGLVVLQYLLVYAYSRTPAHDEPQTVIVVARHES